jgi:hypothetical protein
MNLKKKLVKLVGTPSTNNDPEVKMRSLSSVESKYPVLKVGKGMLEILKKDFPELF